MYILVKLLNGFSQPLTYKIPEKLNNKNLLGKIIKVPLKKKFLPAIVIKEFYYKPKNLNFEIKTAIDLEEFPKDKNYKNFIEKISEFYFVNPIFIYSRISHFLKTKKIDEINFENSKSQAKETIELTQEQQNVVNHVENFIINPKFQTTLLHGVTGSGKTDLRLRKN